MTDHSWASRPEHKSFEQSRLRLTTAKAWQHAMSVTKASFAQSTDMFANPAWEVLLHMYVRAIDGQSVTIEEACGASSIPPSTGLRWLRRLRDGGLVTIASEADGAGTTGVALTDEAIRGIEAALDGAVASDSRLGLQRMELVH